VPLVSGPKAYAPGQEQQIAVALMPVVAAKTKAYREEARDALVDRTLAPPAIQALAAGSDNDREKIAAASLADRVSRRDILAQLVLMQALAREGEDAKALVHLDRILTVSQDASYLVHPAMTSALAKPDFRGLLSAYGHRSWFGPFASFAAGKSENPAYVADLLLRSEARSADWFEPVARRLLDRLATAGDLVTAATFARETLGLGEETRTSFAFTPASTRSQTAPLTWSLAQDVGARADFRPGMGVEIDIEPGKSAILLRRVTDTKPGLYNLDQTIAAEQGDARPALLWELACRNLPGAPVRWSQAIPYPDATARYRTSVTIAQDCQAQEWRLRVTTMDNNAPVRFTIAAIDLSRP
jgi:hypothetical protein